MWYSWVHTCFVEQECRSESVLNSFILLTTKEAGDGWRQEELKTDDQTYGGTFAN
jgi:hypothetical protein